MDREKQINEIYEQIKYGTDSYSDDARRKLRHDEKKQLLKEEITTNEV